MRARWQLGSVPIARGRRAMENVKPDVNIMSKASYKRLEERLAQLEDVERPKIVAEIQRAREHGDLSENSEYDAAREAQRQNESLISELRGQLANARIIEGNADAVSLDDEVELEDGAGERETITIVSTAEVDVLENRISNASPLGAALFNHSVGDTVSYVMPSGKRESVKIVSIKHRDQGDDRSL